MDLSSNLPTLAHLLRAWDPNTNLATLVESGPLACLDGIRAIAVLWVILGHLAVLTTKAVHLAPGQWLPCVWCVGVCARAHEGTLGLDTGCGGVGWVQRVSTSVCVYAFVHVCACMSMCTCSSAWVRACVFDLNMPSSRRPTNQRIWAQPIAGTCVCVQVRFSTYVSERGDGSYV